jgi:Xaa-Pro aminopeptidase
MDVGAEYEHYSADVTRTFRLTENFRRRRLKSTRSYTTHRRRANVARPGALVSDVNRAATEVIKDGLLKLGLITDKNSNQYRIWFMQRPLAGDE